MKPLVLCILDGVGMKEDSYGNAFLKANTPHFDQLWHQYPHSLLEASGTMVGLPEGQMGNSEVGHMNIGAGRIVYQPLQMIHKEIKEKTFFQNKTILELMHQTKNNHNKLHLMGLLSDGGIHSHMSHLFALIDMAKENGIEELYIHVILDGRDTLPNSGIGFVKQLNEKLEEVGIGKIATLSGRFYAMDRDNRWDRVEKAYQVITSGKAVSKTVEKVILDSYQDNITDEFLKPTCIDEKGLITDGDGVIIFNYRPDRLRELPMAMTNFEFSEFERDHVLHIDLVTMMPVSDDVICKNAYGHQVLQNTFGEYISQVGLHQLRIAETEKYAHVTYFFDGGVEKELEGCTRILIPSPKVATYDLKPEMSAVEITDRLLKELEKDIYDVVILNYANGDMVGHTGVMDATIQAVETLDTCLGRLYDKVTEKNGTMVLIADHGNCDTMLDVAGNVVTSHSTALVPFIITDLKYHVRDGKLGDVAPTMLEILGLQVPEEMTGNSLIVKE